ncbi:MAG: hypothetical protein ACNY01_04315 [Desulfobacteria bacterium]
MQNKNFLKTYNGFSTDDILRTWEEIKTPQGTKASRDLILAMRHFLREYRLGLF